MRQAKSGKNIHDHEKQDDNGNNLYSGFNNMRFEQVKHDSSLLGVQK